MEPKFSTLPKKPRSLSLCVPQKAPRSLRLVASLRSPCPSPVRSLQCPLLKPEFGEPHPHSSEPNFSTLPKKPLQPEFCEL